MSRIEELRDLTLATINWGYINFYTPEKIEFKGEERELLLSYLKKKEIQEEFLKFLYSYLSDNLQKAMEFFESMDFTFFSEIDELWNQAEDMFLLFDEINYIRDTAKHVFLEIDKEFSDKVIQITDSYLKKVLDWIDYSEFSSIKLLVFNQLRETKLEQIPEDKRYMFPWYSNLVEYEILDLIENFEKYILAVEKGIFEEIEIPIYLELTKDWKTYELLKNQYLINTKLKAYFSTANPFSLWRLSKEIEFNYPISEAVMNAGLIRTNTVLLEEIINKIKSQNEKNFFLLLIALCGPVLDDRKRIEILNKVLHDIKSALIENENNQEIYRTFQLIKRWAKGENLSFYIVDNAMKFWNTQLENKAQNIGFYEFDLDETILIQKIEELERWTPSVVEEMYANLITAIEKLIYLLSKKPVKKIVLKAQSLIMSEPSGDIETANPLYIKIKETPNEILPDEKILIERNLDYIRLKRNLKGKRGIFWCGFYVSESNITAITEEINEISKKSSFEPKKNNYDAILIVLSEDSEKIKEFLLNFPSKLRSSLEMEDLENLIQEIKDDFVIVFYEVNREL